MRCATLLATERQSVAAIDALGALAQGQCALW